MDPKIIYGYVNADRTKISGSADYSVGGKVETGFYTIVFNKNSFSDTPTVTGTVIWDSYHHNQCLMVTSVEQGQFTLVITETDNNELKDQSFFFQAIGPPDD